MKRLIFAICISLFGICLAIFEVWYVGNVTDKFYKAIDKSIVYAEDDKEKTVKELESIIANLEEASKGIKVFLTHEELEEVMCDLKQMEVMIERDSQQFYFLGAKAKQQLLDIKENELPLFDNIF